MSRGFTLVEVLIAAGLVVILSGLVLPSVLGRLTPERTARAAGNLESAGIIARAEAQQDGRAVLLAALRDTAGNWMLVTMQAGDGEDAAAKVRAWLDAESELEIPAKRRVLATLPSGCTLQSSDLDDAARDEIASDPLARQSLATPGRIALAVFLPDGSAVAIDDVRLIGRDGERRAILVSEWNGVISIGAPIRDDVEEGPLAFGAMLVFACAWRRQRGSVLLEVIASIALIVMCGVTILGAIGQASHSFNVMRERSTAADLTRSAMARLEAGIASTTSLHGPVERWELQEDSDAEAMGDVASAQSTAVMEDTGWELEVDVYPSQFPDLSVVTISAVRVPSGLVGERRVLHTLTQLVRLGSLEEDIAGEADALLGGSR